MKLRNQNRASERHHWSADEMQQAILFWLFWFLFVCLSSIVILSMLTDWPKFLHETPRYFK